MASSATARSKRIDSNAAMLFRKQKETHSWSNGFPTLTIKNFSCIKELKVEFRRIVVFIGEQSSGKSVTCKLYYFFTQAMVKVATACLREGRDVNDFRKQLVREFGLIFPMESWCHDTFSIEWNFGGDCISVTHKSTNKKIKVDLSTYSKRYERAAEKISTYNAKDSRRTTFDASWAFDRFIAEVVSTEIASVGVDYIPAGRSFFSTIQDTVFSLLSNNVGIDYFLKEFGQKLETFRRVRRIWREEEGGQKMFDNLCRQVLHGRYIYDGKDQWIVADKNHRIRLSDASSGQQEVLPLLMLLSRRASLSGRRDALRIVIEEPEAHLFPTAQQDVVDTIGNMLAKDDSIGVIITTHSPFILCCLNNVLKHFPGLQKSVSAYHLAEGGGKAIYETEFGLVNAVDFDDVSFEIANA